MNQVVSSRKMIVMRHAERVDFTFGAWIPSSFDEKGNYIRRNLNMPISVPTRAGGPMDFSKDSPLTRIGLFQAILTGEGIRACGMKFDHVFCSPSLRCVETCTNVLKGSNQTHLKLNIEPGLFEWCGWYKTGMPVYMKLPELRNCGFNINLDYKPVVDVVALSTDETSEMYYMRSFLVTKKILDSYSGNIFILGHAGTLDTCTRQLRGKAPRSVVEMQSLVQKVPYVSVCVAEEQSDQTWSLINPPFPNLKHCDNLGFDSSILI